MEKDPSKPEDSQQDKTNPAKFPELDKATTKTLFTNDKDLGIILDVPVVLSLEVGRTAISIKNLLELNQGSIVELDKTAGEPIDVLVNGTLVAHGEVVVVNDKFGIRLTDIASTEKSS